MATQPNINRLILHDGIEELIARFDDAAIRYDREAFRSLWVENAVWEISVPASLRAVGRDEIVRAFEDFHKVNEFFFRSTSRPVIHFDGDRATFRSPTVELARRAGNIGYANVAVYFDEAILEEGEWRFTRRSYQYLWVDLKTVLNGEIVPLSV